MARHSPDILSFHKTRSRPRTWQACGFEKSVVTAQRQGYHCRAQLKLGVVVVAGSSSVAVWKEEVVVAVATLLLLLGLRRGGRGGSEEVEVFFFIDDDDDDDDDDIEKASRLRVRPGASGAI